MPKACAAIPILPASKNNIVQTFLDGVIAYMCVYFLPRVIIAILKPIPGFPNRFSDDILHSSNVSEQVLLPRMPSLSSFLPTKRPSVGLSTMKALIPLCFLDLSVVANKTIAFDS